jgi:hypothetical protein
MYRNDVVGKRRVFAAAPWLITPMTLQLVIPWRVALQHCPPPLRQLVPILQQTSAAAKRSIGNGLTTGLKDHSAPHFPTAAAHPKHAGFLSNEPGEARNWHTVSPGNQWVWGGIFNLSQRGKFGLSLTKSQ